GGRGATRRGPSSRRPSGRTMWPASIKARGAVLKSEKRERTSPSEDRALGQERRFREGSGWTASRLVGDAVAEGVHRHFRLLLRLPHTDVQSAALDLFLTDHNDVGDPLLFRVAALLSSSVNVIPKRSAFSVSIWSVVRAAALSFPSTKFHSYFWTK